MAPAVTYRLPTIMGEDAEQIVGRTPGHSEEEFRQTDFRHGRHTVDQQEQADQRHGGDGEGRRCGEQDPGDALAKGMRALGARTGAGVPEAARRGSGRRGAGGAGTASGTRRQLAQQREQHGQTRLGAKRRRPSW